VIDITDPQSPQIVGSVAILGQTPGVAVSGTLVYLAARPLGLQILPTHCESSSGAGEDGGTASVMRLRVLSNPSSRQSLIRLETRKGGLVQASVYDPAGRRVRRLSDGVIGVGSHDLSWDGRDDDGHSVAVGIYLVRVSTAEGTTTGRVVLVR